MSIEYPIIFKRTTTNKIQQWQIKVQDDHYWTEQGQVDGKIVINKPVYCLPKNTGKANETTASAQAALEAEAKHVKKLKTGYTLDVSTIDNVFKKPMLAKKFTDYQDKITYPVFVDCKFNGARCIYTDERITSRENNEFFTVPHIHKELLTVFKDDKNAYIDGEFYNFELRKQLNQVIKLVSVGIKAKDITKDLLEKSKELIKYHIYDGYNFSICKELQKKHKLPAVITIDTPFEIRRKALNVKLEGCTYLKPVEHVVCNSLEEILEQLSLLVADGQEGAIIRQPTIPYEHKRSNHLLKLKNFLDAEFKVIGIEEGKGNWVGCAKRIICEVNTKDGVKEFASNIRGSMVELTELLKNKDNYIGQFATIKFQEYSEYGIPQIPYVISWRNYE